MTDLENVLRSIDFSRYSDLKEPLAQRLSGARDDSIPICSLSDESLETVNAAGGFQYFIDKTGKSQ